MQSAFPPQLRTDCQCLLTTASEGAAQATAASRPLARIWNLIATSLDGEIEKIVVQGALVWMPAHQPLSAIGNAELSNGKRLTGVDWRANRLVDALAKQAADTMRLPRAVRCLLESGQAAVKHYAAVLGFVTHAANNHMTTFHRPDGTMGTRIIRDAQQHISRTSKRIRQPRPPPEPKPLPEVEASGSDSCSWPIARPTKQQRVAPTARKRKRLACPTPGLRTGQPMFRRRQSRPAHEVIDAPSCSSSEGHRTTAPWLVEPGPGTPLLPLRSASALSPASASTGSSVQGAQRRGDIHKWAAGASPDPVEELELMSRCGLKVSWPCSEASASGTAVDIEVGAQCGADCSTNSACSPSGSASLGTARVNRAQGTLVCTCPPPAIDTGTFEDLQSLHDCGFKVVWPCGLGPRTIGCRRLGC
jgi:hypothetical protein